MKIGLRFAFLVSFVVGAAFNMMSCVSGDTDSREDKQQLTEEETRIIKEYEAELDLGRNMAGRLLQAYRAYDNKETLQYVNLVGQLVAKNSPFADRQFTFGVLDTDAINAFAAPGGYILITRGALRKVANEAELAGILGHEIAHVGKKHIYDAIIKKSRAEKSDGKSKVPATVSSRKRPEAASSETADTLAKYIGGASGQFNVLSAIQGGITVLLEEGIDPKLEHEADLEGVRYALAAGYEPRAMADYFARILKQKEKLDLQVLNKTHPSIDSRIKRIEEMLSRTLPQEYTGAIGQERFVNRTKGI